ncbi:MAG: preprotein translocase subunit SecE [Patescibacteria group bacterium]
MNPVAYLKDTIAELKAVRWPTRQTTLHLTAVVIGISILVGAYVGALDVTFTKLLSLIIK